MTEKKSCNRCGRCCQVIPLAVKFMHPDMIKYYLNRGLKIDQGFVLIPHDCQHLTKIYSATGRESGTLLHTCTVHDDPNRPKICQRFHGQKQIGPWMMYVPPGCTFVEER